ncbi:MAG: extracellular solute-binding protein, partial [Clostridia bacterium]|nr:extracellular solute-binding protein [Clostridia bacterium]
SYTSDRFKKATSYMCIGSSAGAKNQSPERVDGKYPFEVGVASIPQVHPEKPKVISQGPSICIFKQDDPQEVIASVLLAKFLTTSIGFQAQFSSVSGYVPVITTVMENETYKKNLDDANGYGNLTYLAAKVCMDQASAYYTSPAFAGSSKAREQVGYLMQAVFTETKTIDKAFKDAVDECKYAVG